ncbi:MAG: adenosine deaminase, partial [Gammaproteobacteria bacterium]|nr:adenosine deaminase [Gammaproteobacteria bacterium]
MNINFIVVSLFLFTLPGVVSADWFEDFKDEATKEQLHQFLYEMPKGGDLHLHMSGSGFSEWWFELAL